MVRAQWPWFVLALAGCDQVFGLDRHVAEAGLSDAPQPLHPCKGRTPAPMFCADFDEDLAVAYANGVPIALPVMAPGVTIERRAPSTTGPNGYWFASSGGAGSFSVTSPPAASVLDAEFALRIAQFNPANPAMGSSGLFILGLPHPGVDSCYVGLSIDEAQPRLLLSGTCGSFAYADLPLPAASAWVQVHLRFDLPTGVATAALNGGAPGMVTFTGSYPTPVTPSLALGIDASGHAGLEVGYDDVTVIAQ